MSEKEFLKLSANIISLNARVQTLQDLFFAWSKTETSTEQYEGYVKIFEETFVHYCNEHLAQLPSVQQQSLRKILQLE